MKRFWCNTCGRVKRVRRLPKNVVPNTVLTLDNVEVVESYSDGDCDRHSRPSNVFNRQVFGRVKVLSGIGKTKHVSASSARSKSKH